MGRVNYTPEQIISRLRKVEVLCSQGQTIKRLVADLSLDNAIWKDINEGKL